MRQTAPFTRPRIPSFLHSSLLSSLLSSLHSSSHSSHSSLPSYSHSCLHLRSHHPLIESLFSVSRLFFLLVFLFCCFSQCDSTKILTDVSHVPFSHHSRQILPLLWKRRVARSPFMHPTVTSFQSAKRKSNNRQHGKVDLSRVGVSSVNILPPMVRGMSGSKASKQKQNAGERKQNGGGRKQNGGHLLLQSKISSTSFLPSHPLMVTSSRKSPQKKLKIQKVSIQPQNDQHLSATDGRISVFEQERTTKAPKPTPRIQKNLKKEKYSEEKTPNKKLLTNFYEVLEAVGKTTEELQNILRKEKISFDNFLGFIDKGRTRKEILEFLKLIKYSVHHRKNSRTIGNGKIYQPKSFSRNEYENEGVNLDRQKMLSELPFTEIVHEVPIETNKPYANSFKIPNYDLKTPEVFEHSQKRKMDYDKFSKQKRNKQPKEKKSYRLKPTKYQEKNPYLMHSRLSVSPLPPQDSPMVIPFLNSKKRDDKKANGDRASIISLTFDEKKMTSGVVIVSKGTPRGPIPVRSKIITHEEETPTKGLIASTFSKSESEKRWKDNFYENHPSNLRFVFPMRGILMFCGVLGIITVVTILILIIYGTVKCNRKSVSEDYQMNEHNTEGEDS